MTLNHTPSPILTKNFSEWLDYCILGAEEVGRLDATRRFVTERNYNRPLTAQQQSIRARCKQSAARHATGAVS